MTEPSSPYNLADTLRKNKEYSEAIIIFRTLWEENCSPMVGWRYAFCLRKSGFLDEAEKIARAALSKYSDDKYTKSELGWIIYEKELKPAKAECDLGRTICLAKEILLLNQDSIAVKQVTLIVIKVAKEKKKWDIVLEWSDKINPEDLSAEPRLINGKHVMSERETWYVGRARSLLELEFYPEARAFSQNALEHFPGEVFLIRTGAQANAEMGNIDEAIEELQTVLTNPRAGWYFKADLAELQFRKRNYSEAYRLICDALLNSQDDEFKLNCFLTLGKIAHELGKNDIVLEHIALAKAIRTANNWSIPSELSLFEKEIRTSISNADLIFENLPKNVTQLSKICHDHWKKSKNEGLLFFRGALGPINPERPFAFIKREDGEESVFVKIKNIPRNSIYEGAKLEFTLQKSFDKKKNKESYRAENIRSVVD